jgi:hypothetical protein
MWAWPFLLIASACGRIDFQARPRDAAIDTVADAMPDGIVAPSCGPPILMQDEFDDGVAAPLFVVDNDPGMTMSEAGGTANANFGVTVAEDQFAFYRSAQTFPVDGLCVVVEVKQLPQNGGFGLLKVRAGSREAEFFTSLSTFDLRTHDTNVLQTIDSVAFDPTLRFWRIRVQDDTVYWDLSSDAVTYHQQLAKPGLFVTTTADAILGGGASSGGTTGADAARFERIVVTGS